MIAVSSTVIRFVAA